MHMTNMRPDSKCNSIVQRHQCGTSDAPSSLLESALDDLSHVVLWNSWKKTENGGSSFGIFT